MLCQPMNLQFFRNKIESLRTQGLLRTLLHRECNGPGHHGSAAIISIGTKHLVNFSSNDYLGLSGHPRLVSAATEALAACGVGAAASRLLAGGTTHHRQLETEVALFKGTGAAIVFNSGYTANTSVIPALAGKDAVIFSDELNHASIVDGCRLSRGKKVVYRHCDASHLKELLSREDSAVDRLIVTDSIFSMDGDIAPLDRIYDVCKSTVGQNPGQTILYIDDAHGTGVLGNGRGALAHFGLTPEPWIVQMGTFSKALGSFGAYVAADPTLVEWLVNSCRGLIYSTALPPSVIAASSAALALVSADRELTAKLWRNRQRLYDGVITKGFRTTQSRSPIIPVLPPYPGSSEREDHLAATLRLADLLCREGIYAPAIRPPTVPVPRIRFTVTAAHSDEDIDYLLDVLSRFA